MIGFNTENTLVMVVDDEELNLKIVDSMLKMENFPTLLIKDPTTAVEKAAENNPDVILLDVSMQKKNGFEVCSELKKDQRTAKIPVLFLSGQNSSDFIIKGLGLGAHDYITKPFNAPELLARVKTHVKLKLAVDQLIEMEQIKALQASLVSQNHTFNQLITSVLGHIEIIEILSEKERFSDKMKESVKAIEKAALEMQEVIMKFTRINKVKYEKYSARTNMLDLDGSAVED